MNNVNSSHLRYPIFLIEKIGGKHTKYGVIKSKTGFSTLSRVPIKNQFTKGYIFDSHGKMFSYEGDCGKPRFDGWVKVVLEALIIPPIVTKLLELFVYFGPRLNVVSMLNIEEFQTQILEKLTVYEDGADLDVLKRRMRGEGEFSEVIEAVDWYIWNDKGNDDYQ